MNIKIPQVLTEIAAVLGTEVQNGYVYIPEKFGSGYCAGAVYDEKMRILILDYELKVGSI